MFCIRRSAAKTSGSDAGKPRLLFLLIFILFLAACASEIPEGPAAVRGLLDLRAWDFSDAGPVKLSGEWTFTPDAPRGGEPAAPGAATFRMVPDLWKAGEAGGERGRGAGTYRLKVLLPPTRLELAIRYGTVSTAFELNANGKRIAGAGTPSPDPAGAAPGCRTGVAAVDDADEIMLTVHVSNHEYRTGGMWRAFLLGSREELEEAWKRKRDTSVMLFAFFTALSLNSLMIYLFRRKEGAQLTFAVFTFVLAIRPLVTGEYAIMELLPGFPFSWMIRLMYLASFLPVPLGTEFIFRLYQGTLSRPLKLALSLPPLPFVALALAAPLPVLTSSIYAFYAVAVLCLAGLLAVLIRAVAAGLPDAPALTLSAAAMVAAGINDMLHASFIIQTGYALPYSMVLMVGIQAAILCRRFTAAFSTAETLSEENRTANRNLKEEIDRRSAIQGQLEGTVVEKDNLLRNVHHWVRNSLQIVSSYVSLERNRTEDPRQAARYGDLRSRIGAIALVHERLYESGSTEQLELRPFMEELIDILTSGNDLGASWNAKLKVEDVKLTPKMCIDLGLILAELFSNFLKFALPPGGVGELRLGARIEEDCLVLNYADDGPGFPPGFSPGACRTLGYRTLYRMVESYEGTCSAAPGAPARLEIRMPLAGAR